MAIDGSNLAPIWHKIYFIKYTIFPRLQPGSTYPSKLIEPTVIESRFQPSLDLNLGDFGP